MRRRSSGRKTFHPRGTRKERRTFTLSRESIALLDELTLADEGIPRRSASAVLDSLLRALRKERRREAVARAVAQYYSDLPEPEHAADIQWGEFALGEFPDKEA